MPDARPRSTCHHNGTGYVWKGSVPGVHGPRAVWTGCPLGPLARLRGYLRHRRNMRRARA